MRRTVERQRYRHTRARTFNAAQNVAAARQCDRAIHVVMVDGQRAMFRSQCPASGDVQIECAGDACVAMQPAGMVSNG